MQGTIFGLFAYLAPDLIPELMADGVVGPWSSQANVHTWATVPWPLRACVVPWFCGCAVAVWRGRLCLPLRGSRFAQPFGEKLTRAFAQWVPRRGGKVEQETQQMPNKKQNKTKAEC